METIKIEETVTPANRSFVRIGEIIVPADAVVQVRVYGLSLRLKVVGQDEEIDCGLIAVNKYPYQWQKDKETAAQKTAREKNNAKHKAEEKRLQDKALTALIGLMNNKRGPHDNRRR